MTPFLAQTGSWISFDVHGLAQQFWNNTVDGLALGGIYALVALGYTLVYGVLKLINFAHSEVFVVGAFATWLTFYALGFRSGTTPVLSVAEIILFLAIACLAAMAASGGTAVLLERVAYRPLRKRNAPRLVFLITAIGASFAIQQGLRLVFGLNQQPQIRLLQPETLFRVFGASVTNIHVILFVAAILLWFVADYFVNRTRLGRGIRAVAQDPDTATLMA